jgi:hypothetical protein
MAGGASEGWVARFKRRLEADDNGHERAALRSVAAAPAGKKLPPPSQPPRHRKRAKTPLQLAVQRYGTDDFVLRFWYERLRRTKQGPWCPLPSPPVAGAALAAGGARGTGQQPPRLSDREQARMDHDIRSQLLQDQGTAGGWQGQGGGGADASKNGHKRPRSGMPPAHPPPCFSGGGGRSGAVPRPRAKKPKAGRVLAVGKAGGGTGGTGGGGGESFLRVHWVAVPKALRARRVNRRRRR